MTKHEWAKLFAHEAVRIAMFVLVAFILWKVFRKKGDNAKAAVATAASVASGVPMP